MTDKNILLVEGTDDEHVVKHLCGHYSLFIDRIRDCKGVDELLKEFPVQLKNSGIEALGVVVDADVNIQARWESIKNHLMTAGYPDVPQTPDAQGSVIQPPVDSLLPRVGVWLMPDNQTNGILEDFLRFLVPQPNGLLNYAQHCINRIPDGQRRFETKDETKALMHTWLAWQKEPGKPFGTAITARYLDANIKNAGVFVDWLKRLFFS